MTETNINPEQEAENTNSIPAKKIYKLEPRKIMIGLGSILTISLLIFVYYKYNEIYPGTDNAYVKADIINISPKVGGYVSNVYVKNNQYVHKGDILVEIDPIDYQLKEDQAKADVMKSNSQLEIANERVNIAKSNVLKSRSALLTATSMSDRYTKLYKEDAGSLQNSQKYLNQKIQASKALDQAISAEKQAQIQIDIANAGIKLAQSNDAFAQLNIDYTKLVAPSDGYVTNLKIYVGQLVSPGQALFGFVDSETWWIDANFKETDLKRIKPGQKVEVELDMYDHKYEATVNSVSYASGSAFSLLPPENATGNWVKVTQRFPVKIVIKDDPKYPLRYGASATVSINTY